MSAFMWQMVRAAKEEAQGASLVGQTPAKRSRLTRAATGVAKPSADFGPVPPLGADPTEPADEKHPSKPVRRSRRKTAQVVPLLAQEDVTKVS